MRLLIITFSILFMSIAGYSQNGINYKAIIKDTNGNIVTNSLIVVQFRVLVTLDQILAYEEIHTPTTDNNGLIIINISEGISNTEFPEFIWRDYDEHFLNVQIDTGGGYIDMGTTQFNQVPLAKYATHSGSARSAYEVINITGLDRVDGEGNTYGWRLSSTNPNNYSTIGGFAVDLSIGMFNDQTTGATGDYAFASGLENISSNFASTAMGQFSIASGSVSTAIGAGAEATGQFSTAMGYNTRATEYASTAIGNTTTAFGSSSTALGYNTIAYGQTSIAGGIATSSVGNISAAFGYQTVAQSNNSFVIGRYNEYSGISNNWDYDNQLFVIGNGTSINRNNAMTVLGNGNIGIGTNEPLERFHITGGRLRIGTETIEDTGSNRLSFNADLLPDVDNAMQLGNSNFHWTGVWATDGTINTSDRREKKNIKNLNYGLAEILKLNPVSYNWKSSNNPDLKLGLIAQDLLKVIPEVVKTHQWETDEDGIKIKKELERMGVYYSDLVPVLIKAIQEQQKIIDHQNTNYSSLLERVEALENNKSN